MILLVWVCSVSHSYHLVSLQLCISFFRALSVPIKKPPLNLLLGELNAARFFRLSMQGGDPRPLAFQLVIDKNIREMVTCLYSEIFLSSFNPVNLCCVGW